MRKSNFIENIMERYTMFMTGNFSLMLMLIFPKPII